MRKLPFLLILLLLSLMLLAAAASAHASSLPIVGQPALLAAPADDEAEADEGEAGEESSEAEEDGEGDDCSAEEDEEGPCEEEGDEPEAEGCLLEEADASVVAVRGRDLVRLSVHYRALQPTAVDVDARLHGGKGGLHLGSERTRFHGAGVYRKSFKLGPKQMPKALAAREFTIDLRALDAPADCELRLTTRGSRLAR
jgi:hypothetical protein